MLIVFRVETRYNFFCLGLHFFVDLLFPHHILVSDYILVAVGDCRALACEESHFREEAQDAVVLNNFLDVLLLSESVKRQLELSMLLDARPHKFNLSPAAPLKTTTE